MACIDYTKSEISRSIIKNRDQIKIGVMLEHQSIIQTPKNDELLESLLKQDKKRLLEKSKQVVSF